MGNYATEAEVRAEGGSASADRINARIEKWEGIVEAVTQNYFYVLEPGELRFDGNNMGTLFFSLPLLEVSSLMINDETVALDPDQYIAYTSIRPPVDHRRNPRIELTPTGTVSPLFRSIPDIFLKGYWQRVTAKWGFVDYDGLDGSGNPKYKTPRAIKDAVIQLVCLDLDGYFERGSASYRTALSETTDGHSVTFKDAAGFWSMMPDSIADVLKLYRRPQIISAPDPNVVVDPSSVIYGW